MNQNRRIIIFAGSGIGGTEKCATLFAANLKRRGHSVGYVSLPGPRAEELKREGVKVITPSDDPRAIARFISDFRVEIVQLIDDYAMARQQRAMDVDMAPVESTL